MGSDSTATESIDELPEFDDALLSIEDLETGYGDFQILYGATIHVNDDEIVLIFGPNGAGKSTLLKAIMSIIPVWGGAAEIMDEDVSSMSIEEFAANGINYVPQKDNVFSNLTVDENLDIGGSIVDDKQDRKEYLYSLFPKLSERKKQQAGTLSGGERQLLAMARALMPDPSLLLIDEPSAGLSPNMLDQTFEYIQKINDEGTAILMVEQNVQAALEIADRGYVLDGGQTKFEGPADTLSENDKIGELYLG